MSKTIDERVVEMRFDNKNFESNVATSMSTLEKLKEKLNLSGATKGLEDINAAAGKVNMSGLGSGVDSVKAKFSALDVVAVTALANITNQAINAGEKLVKSLSIDQITAGWQKFSDKTTSVATLVAQGNAIEDVNDQLDRLNWYTDETSYNFTDMVSNIAKFTATGKGLEESVTAMEGIANWAALSGQNASTASRAMYQLSQAMGAGVMRLEDYKSIQNASMDTEEFRQKCLDAAVALGTLKDNGDGTYTSLVEGASDSSFTISQFTTELTDGMWLTSDVMMDVFNTYSSAVSGIYEATETTGKLASEIIDEVHDKANELKTDAMTDEEAINAAIKELGYTLEDGSLMFDSFGLKAFESAQKARTFTDAIDSVKDAVSTGWMNTFELIFGDAEKATELWTDLANTLYDVFAASGEVRNWILEIALNFAEPWSAIKEKLEGIGAVVEKVENVTQTVSNAAEKLAHFQDVVNKVWKGDYNNRGDDPDRFALLEQAGYNAEVIQELVNKGYQYELTIEDVEAAHKKFGLTLESTTEETKKTIDATNEATSAFESLSDEQLEQAGLTEEEIALYRALEKEAKRLGMTVGELAEEMSTNDGRTLLIDSFKNFGSVILGTIQAVKEAWVEIFNPPGAEELAVRLYGIIKSLNEFSEKVRITDKETGELNETGEKIKRTFEGVFAIVDLVTTALGGGLKIAFRVVKEILDAFDVSLLDVTAGIGDTLVSFRDWVFENNSLAESLNGLIDKLPGLIADFKEWFAVFKETPAVQKLVDAIDAIREAFSDLTGGEIDLNEFARSLGENLAKALTSIPEIAIQIGKDFIAGFQNGIEFSISDVIGNVVDFCINFVSAFAEALGVQSPSWKAYDTATDFFQGFINGAKDVIGSVVDILKKIGEQIVKVFKSLWAHVTDENGDVEWGKLFAAGSIVTIVLTLKQLAEAFSSVAGAFDGIGDLLSGAGKTLKSFSKVLNGISWDLKAQALLKMAGAIAILVAAIWVLTTIDDIDKLWNAVAVVTVLAAVLVALSLAMSKLSTASIEINKKGASISGIQSSLVSIGVAILLVAATAKLISSMDSEEAKQGFIGLAGVAAGMLVFLAAMGGISRYAGDVSGMGSMMKKMAVAMLLMVVVCKLVGMLSAEDIGKGILFAGAFTTFIALLTLATKNVSSEVSNIGSMAIKLSVAMILLVAVCKLAGTLSTEEMEKGAIFAAAFVVFVGALVAVTKVGSEQKLAQVSGLILSVSVSLTLLVGVCKLVGTLSTEEMIKGAAFVAAFVILLKVLVSILTISNEQQMAQVAGTILAMSGAIAILAAVSVLLSFMDLGSLAKGITAVGLLSAMMTIMIKSLKGANEAKGSIMMMAIAIAVMAASIAALSFIDTQSLISAAGSMTLVMSAFALMIKSMKGLGTVKVTPLIALSGVVLILAGIIYILQDIDPTSAISSAGSLALLMTSMAVVLKILDSMKNISSATKAVLALTAMAVPLLAFSIVLRQMNGIENAMDNVLALTVLMTAMTVLLAAVSLVGQYLSAGIIPGIASLTAMVIPMVAFVEVLKHMDGIEDASGKIESLTTMMTTMTALLAVLAIVGLGGPAAIIGIGSLVALFAAIGTLAVGIGALMDEFPSIQNFLDKGLPVLEQLAGSIGTMVGKFIGGIGEGLSDSLVKMGEDIAEFMSQLAIASDNASGIKGESFDGVKQLMDVMGDIALTTVGTTISDIFTLGGTSMEKFQKDGVAFFDAMKAIGEASSDVNIDEESMGAVIGVAQKLADLQSSLEPIGGVISWFTGRDDLATFGKNATEFVSAMVTAFGSDNNVKLDTESVDTIIGAATSLVDLQHSLEPIGGVISWFTGRDDLSTFGINVAAFVLSMKLAFSSLGDTELNTDAMDSIISAATSLADLQSSLEPIGGVISWFTGRDDLGTFGINVASFITSMKIALQTLDGVTLNDEALTSVITASERLSELQSKLEPIGGVISWFTGRDDLGTFGVKVSEFIGSMKTALQTLDGATLNEEALTSVITAAERLSELQSKLEPMGGVVSWFAGRTDLGTFGTNVGLFADAMGKLKTGMGENGISEEVVASVTNAGNAIIALQKALPEEHWFDGKMNLTEFSEYITDFATAMSTFGTKASEIDSGAVSTVISTAYRIKSLIESLVDLDTSGVEAFTGIGTGGIGADGPAYDIARAISKFGSEVKNINTEAVTVAISAANKLKSLISSLVGLDTSGIENFKPGEIGKQMKSYADKVAGIDTTIVSSSISSANRLKSFISGLAGLDTSGISNFKVSSIGASLKDYAASVSGFDAGAVSSSISAANRLKSFISGLAGLDTSGVGSFKTTLNTLATVDLGNFVKAFSDASSKLSKSGADMITGLINGMKSNQTSLTSVANTLIMSINQTILSKASLFTKSGQTLADNLSNGMKSKQSTLTSTVTTLITAANRTLSSKASSFKTAGQTLGGNIASGVSSKQSAVTSAASSCVSGASSAIRSYYSSFYSAGSYLASGLASGISANISQVTAAASNMASSAANIARRNLQINSPSRVFKEIGSRVPEGFAIGIKMLSGEVKDSVENMASTAVNTTRNAMTSVLEAMNADMDTQPTIRPVVDLSDVKTGAAAVSGMFNRIQTVGVRSNLNAINVAMNAQLQNGTNDDVVNAINKLRDGLDGNRGDTYNFGGITYDDGSNITEAVQTLVRAAKMGRRV